MSSLRSFDEIDWAVAIGHLHPLVLHLPIGLFVGLAFLQLVCRDQRVPGVRRAHGALVTLLVLFTPLTGVSGWLLHEEGGYGEGAELHEWFGIGLSFLALGVGVAFLRRSKAYGWLVALGLLLLFPTGHLGATLTHGEDFLLGPWRVAPADPPPAALEFPPTAGAEQHDARGDGADAGLVAASAVGSAQAAPPSYADVQPVLARLCDRCHGERKQRGGLDLSTLELAQRGGDLGPAVVLGDPDASLLLQRLALPLEHEDHMPPASKTQPSAEDLALLRAWIAGTPVEAPAPGEARAASTEEPRTEGGPAPRALAPAAVADPAAVAALRARLVHVQPLAQGRPELWLDFAAATLAPGELRSLVEPLGPLVSELWLARQPLDAADLAFVGALPALRTLDLRALPGDPRSLGELAPAAELRALNLAGTPLAPEALAALRALPSLERVHLWGSGLDAEALRADRPALDVITTGPPPAAPLETEDEVVFVRAGADDAGGEPAPAAAPINARCPVTGSPVDPRYTLTYQGSVVGFCCPNCPKTFSDDPQPFLAALGLDGDPKNGEE